MNLNETNSNEDSDDDDEDVKRSIIAVSIFIDNPTDDGWCCEYC